MRKSTQVFISDILESIEKIEEYTQGLTDKDFYNSSQIQDSTIRRLEIIGEAAKNIPPEFKDQHPQIPWYKVMGMRNILTHEYFGVKLELLWDTIKKDLPKLKKQISNLEKTG